MILASVIPWHGSHSSPLCVVRVTSSIMLKQAPIISWDWTLILFLLVPYTMSRWVLLRATHHHLRSPQILASEAIMLVVLIAPFLYLICYCYMCRKHLCNSGVVEWTPVSPLLLREEKIFFDDFPLKELSRALKQHTKAHRNLNWIFWIKDVNMMSVYWSHKSITSSLELDWDSATSLSFFAGLVLGYRLGEKGPCQNLQSFVPRNDVKIASSPERAGPSKPAYHKFLDVQARWGGE